MYVWLLGHPDDNAFRQSPAQLPNTIIQLMLLGKLNITPNCPDLNKHCKVIVWFTTTCDDGSTDNVTSPEKYFIKKKSIIFSNFRSFERNTSNFFLK